MSPRPPRTPTNRPLLALALLLAGCSAAAREQPERSGDEARGALPRGVSELVRPGAILGHDEEGHEGAYRLRILREPGGTWLEFPKAKPRGFEQHDMPPPR